jgi:hypothetical protein
VNLFLAPQGPPVHAGGPSIRPFTCRLAALLILDLSLLFQWATHSQSVPLQYCVVLVQQTPRSIDLTIIARFPPMIPAARAAASLTAFSVLVPRWFGTGTEGHTALANGWFDPKPILPRSRMLSPMTTYASRVA